MSGGLVWGKKCAAVLLGRVANGLQDPCAEVAPRAAGRSWAPGISRPNVCERRSREVFGYELVECMGAVYSRGTESYVRGYRESALGASMCTWNE